MPVPAPAPSLVRGDALERASELLVRARSGVPMPLLVLGDAGSGKSTLLRQLLGSATGTVVIWIRPADTDLIPFAAASAALVPHASTLAGTPRGDLLDELLDAMGPAARPGSIDRVLQLWVDTLHALDEFSPVIVCIDDLHLADVETRAIYWHLARHLRERRIWVIAASRSAAYDLDPQTADRFARAVSDGVVEARRLDPLSWDELRVLVEETVAISPTDQFVGALSERSGGNLFFAAELLAGITRDQQQSNGDDLERALVDFDRVPATITAAVTARCQALGSEAFEVATALAVLGSIPLSRLDVLAELTDSVADAAESFDLLVRANLVTSSEERFEFRHQLIRDALLEAVGPARRHNLHRNAAAILTREAEAGRLEMIEAAEHVRLTALPPDSAAAHVLIRAGDSVSNHSPAMASRWYQAALRLVPADDPELEMGVSLSLSIALALAGAYEQAAQIAIESLPSLAGERRAKAVELALSALRSGLLIKEAVAIADDALADATLRTPRLLLQRAQLAVFGDDPNGAAAFVEEADLLGARDDPGLSTMRETVQLNLDVAQARFDDAERRTRKLRSTIAGRRTPPVQLLIPLMIHAAVNDDPEVALQDAEAIGRAGARSDGTYTIASWALYRQGRWDEAVDAAWSALEPNGLGISRNHVISRATLIAIAVERDRIAEAAEHVAEADKVEHNRILADVATARWHQASGNGTVAHEYLSAALERYRRMGRVNFVHFVLAASAELAALRCDYDAARQALAELEHAERRGTTVTSELNLNLARARVNHDSLAADAALEIALRHGLRVDAATALGLVGVFRDEIATIERAHNELQTFGATARARLLGAELRARGKSVRATGPSRLLTSTEADVARLIAQGLANKEIAKVTGLSRKTVETYVTRILAKTSMPSRIALAIAIVSGSLDPDATAEH